VDWLIYKPFTQQAVFEMLTALYSDALEHSPEVEETVAEAAAAEAPVSPEEPASKNSALVDAFLNGMALEHKTGGEKTEQCFYCKSAHQFFVATDGLDRSSNDYAAFVDKLKEAIWKYVKSDRVVSGMIDQGQLGETAEYCAQMKKVLADLGVYKLACLAELLEQACLQRHEEDITALNNAFTFILKQTISSLDQFIEQAKYKIR
jgi:hypothetical protein